MNHFVALTLRSRAEVVAATAYRRLEAEYGSLAKPRIGTSG